MRNQFVEKAFLEAKIYGFDKNVFWVDLKQDKPCQNLAQSHNFLWWWDFSIGSFFFNVGWLRNIFFFGHIPWKVRQHLKKRSYRKISIKSYNHHKKLWLWASLVEQDKNLFQALVFFESTVLHSTVYTVH